MALSLTKRAVKGSPINVTEHDQNLTDIETLVNTLETLVGGEDWGTLEARVTVNETDIANVESGQATNDTELADHETRVTANEAHAAASSGNPHAVTKAEVSLAAVTNDAQMKRAAADMNSFTGKTTPVDADIALIEDSAASYAKKKLTWANLKAAIKAYTDTLYETLGIKLDDLAAPDDNTDLDASESAHGLCPKLGMASVDTAFIPMVLFNTDDTPPSALSFPSGTIYVQYTH